jgi:iron complex transport system ATP-binding protein
MPGAVRATLDRAAGFGPFFSLADSKRDASTWHGAALLYRERSEQLAELTQTVARQLNSTEPRVAASIFFLGYASRLLSPQLASLAIDGRIADLPSGRLAWRRPAGQLIELGCSADTGWEAPPKLLLERLLQQAITEHLLPLAKALRSRCQLASGLVNGNIASALVGALIQLRPVLGSTWRDLAAQAVHTQWLAESGELRRGTPVFVRRSCCLYYRIPQGGFCGDCPLHPRSRRAGAGRSANQEGIS